MVSGENGTFGRIGGVNKTNGDSGAEWVKLIGGGRLGVRGAICGDGRGICGQLEGGGLGKVRGRKKWVSVTKFKECRVMMLEVARPFRVMEM